MRFSILYYVPSFLGYGEEKESDAKVIYSLLMKKEFSGLDEKIQIGIAEFLLRSEMITETQSLKLRKSFNISSIDE